MALRTFKLSATVVGDQGALRPALEHFLGPKGTLTPTGDGFTAQATLVGVEARELNRQLLSALRRHDKGAHVQSEWTADGETERFRDYVFVKERGPT